MPDNNDTRVAERGKRLCAAIDAWNLHAAVTVHANDDVGLQNLCRSLLLTPSACSNLSNAGGRDAAAAEGEEL